MIMKLCVAGVLALSLTACQSSDPKDYAADRECLQKKVGSKILSKVVGVGLGAVVPGGGLAGRAVGLATDPRRKPPNASGVNRLSHRNARLIL
jgi:hypothetical protein